MKSSWVLRSRVEKVCETTMRGRRGLSSLTTTNALRIKQIAENRSFVCEGYSKTTGIWGTRPLLSQWLRSGHHPNHILSRNIHVSTSQKSWHTSPRSPPTSHPTKTLPLPEQLRSIMRLLPHSAVVCTSQQPGDGPRAMTMSSFTSLTLSPTPLVTFNIATPSRTLNAIRASDSFCVHILVGDERGASVADHFTKGNAGGNALEGFEHVYPEEEKAPVLSGEGIMFALRCRVVKDAVDGGLMRVRDHVIVVGEVVEMVRVNGEEDFGLVYADRRYRQVGEALENDDVKM